MDVGQFDEGQVQCLVKYVLKPPKKHEGFSLKKKNMTCGMLAIIESWLNNLML
jgi:hypothetical protein